MTTNRTFFDQFVAAAEVVESDLDEICYDSVEANKTLRETVTRAFKLGVAEGLATGECIVARSLKIKVDEMENSDNPALRALMKLSIQCHRAAAEMADDGVAPVRPSARSRKEVSNICGKRFKRKERSRFSKKVPRTKVNNHNS